MQEFNDTEVTPEQISAWENDDDTDFDALRAELGMGDESVIEEDIDEPTETDEIEILNESEGDEPDEVVEDESEEDSEDEDEIDVEQPEDEDDKSEDSDNDEIEEKVEDELEVEDEEDPEKSDKSEPESKEDESKTYKVKAHGNEFDFSIDELLKLAPKAMDYTRKTQELAPWRRTISALKDNELGEDDVNLMIDAIKGNKDAITEVLKRNGVEALDLDVESHNSYQPVQHGQDEVTQDFNAIVNEISMDKEFPATRQVVDNSWDQGSRDMMLQKPEMLRGLHLDIKNGVYEQIAPLALKMKALEGGDRSDIEYYIDAGKQFFEQQAPAQPKSTPAPVAEVEQEQARQAKQASIKERANKRRAATPTKSASGNRDVIDYLDDDDEAFNDWYKRTMNDA